MPGPRPASDQTRLYGLFDRSLPGLTETFYGHFENRGALLDSWEQAAIDEVLEEVERSGGDPRTNIRRAGALTFSETLLPVELAVRQLLR